jgi:FixJ family two-component response regulator
MTPAGALTVFVIDGDASVRESIQDLLESSALHSESFAAAEETSCEASCRTVPAA